MLTASQKEYLEKIPEGDKADIQPWDSASAKFAETLVKQLEESTGLEVFWEGSLALGIPGQNDIDLYIFSEPKDFSDNLPKLLSVLGEPTYILEDKILWRVVKDGHKIDACLGSKNLKGAQGDAVFFNSLKEKPELLKEYTALKQGDLSAREYYQRKNEFYNRVIGLK
ncbi:MAG: hypothetical protein COV10_04660 [Candidatus Vogelbacteria bacterium CG10_big_fil_rev_8_21_14_0_10_51_16]|uniref:Polymerase nucleotidyl transferase domain-containing protein n=1 Tax=Candidatus Vogelbacteria bacterium CG10_big_fil_rev_8_21_14_0_10_51_16 TaxID=1975045 RepID=A0A2H0RD96_9BACT|nr:MAG: hypothetical protein COV10_04660 [Candidatus Vogelbacteria bacterium CG10_big_fil_rev_8_21_14_0_10_51_16]